MPRFMLEDYPWDRVAASREFITDLYRPEASPSRPGVLMHYPLTAELPAPHAYVNTDTNFAGYGEFMTAVLAGWRPGLRLFIHPCLRRYIPALAREIAFDREAVLAALAQ